MSPANLPQLAWSRHEVALVTLALTISEIFRLEIFDLENLGQGHAVRHSQWSHPMANINIFKHH